MRTTPARCWLAIALALLAGTPAAAKSFYIARQSIEATVRSGEPTGTFPVVLGKEQVATAASRARAVTANAPSGAQSTVR